tara:strand:- start:5336 stop:6544 length:1209 start_codon:yes stop_codon:yes gene_type:complete
MKNFQWKNNTVTQMHIELSNGCNAGCPFCQRFVYNSPLVRPDLILNEITLTQFEKWFYPDFIKSVQGILFCGTHGDPLMCKDIIEIIKYIRNNSDATVKIHTNGGLRQEKFWVELAEVLNNRDDVVTFSVDGLEDTNHLYRRKVNWKILIRNIKAFISSGGKADWEYLIFKHNENQIEEAKQLANKLGFNRIKLKRALGFEHAESVGIHSRAIYDKEGNVEYVIEPPTDEGYINTANLNPDGTDLFFKKFDFSFLKDHKKGYNPTVENALENFDPTDVPQWYEEYNTHDVSCKSCQIGRNNTSEVYVNCHGIVYPCCFVGTRIDSSLAQYEDTQLRHFFRKEGIDNFDLNKIPIHEILNKGHLDNVFTNRWEQDSIKDGKMCYCAQTCGSKSQIDRIYVDRY